MMYADLLRGMSGLDRKTIVTEPEHSSLLHASDEGSYLCKVTPTDAKPMWLNGFVFFVAAFFMVDSLFVMACELATTTVEYTSYKVVGVGADDWDTTYTAVVDHVDDQGEVAAELMKSEATGERNFYHESVLSFWSQKHDHTLRGRSYALTPGLVYQGLSGPRWPTGFVQPNESPVVRTSPAAASLTSTTTSTATSSSYNDSESESESEI